jgi:hypothetical protein
VVEQPIRNRQVASSTLALGSTILFFPSHFALQLIRFPLTLHKSVFSLRVSIAFT